MRRVLAAALPQMESLGIIPPLKENNVVRSLRIRIAHPMEFAGMTPFWYEVLLRSSRTTRLHLRSQSRCR